MSILAAGISSLAIEIEGRISDRANRRNQLNERTASMSETNGRSRNEEKEIVFEIAEDCDDANRPVMQVKCWSDGIAVVMELVDYRYPESLADVSVMVSISEGELIVSVCDCREGPGPRSGDAAEFRLPMPTCWRE